MDQQRTRLLINLPAGFYEAPILESTFARLEQLTDARQACVNTPEEMLSVLPWADAVLMWSWPALTDEILDRCPNLRLSLNLDIGQESARTLLWRGIPVSVSRRGFSPAVAEMALTLILACLRRTSTYHAAMWQGAETWVARFPDDVNPDERELTGRRIGIVGFGAIGRRLAELLGPFRCDVHVHDPFVSQEAADRYGVRVETMDALAESAEILVVCAANNPGSRHVVERRHIEALPKAGVLVNVARAALVDMPALQERLERGDLYAALDVFDREPLEADSPLRRLPNVYLTPHRAGGIMASVRRIVDYLADDLEAFLAGRDRSHALTEEMIPALDA